MDAAAPQQQQQVSAETKNVKPCCVCKPQKAERDECVLFHGQDSPDCKPILDQYKDCMRGYGFTV